MTRSTGTRGLILLESLPSLFIASRMQARSTTAGTPVKSCSRTRAGLKGISTCFTQEFSQSIIFSTSSLVTWKLSQLRIADSRRILIEYGNLSILGSLRDGRL
ncbi:hypothetical protein V8G54_026002 [Vigna mungo]|uniref:Uncharacterized protein n=1 Tax=Vigna mungo TaxID=3915 RepID=A0AAQ3MYU1_VIGMU